MKKDLQNAMTNRFQKMVDPKQQEEVQAPKSTTKAVKQPKQTVKSEPIMNEPVVEQPIVQNIQPHVYTQPIPEPVPQYIPEPVPQPVQQVQPVANISNNYQQPVQNIAYVEDIVTEDDTVSEEAPVTASRHTNKKTIPLMPEEKSSGVLHIRLGELRSYVDFMTQSGKISYQQYISNLIQQDYEKNKDLYLKYKSFMDQLNF